MSRKSKRSKGKQRKDEAEVPGAENAEPEETGLEPTEAEAATDETPEGEGLVQKVELERAEAEREELRELLQRKQAEFENYRKRIEREKADVLAHAAADLVKEVLPVLDNLERAIEAAEENSDPQLVEGVKIVHRQFRDILTRRGLEEIPSADESFDPHVHEAVSRVETEDHTEGKIVDVFQKGYRFKDRLLRPSMVSVAQNPEGAVTEGTDSESEVDQDREDEIVQKKE